MNDPGVDNTAEDSATTGTGDTGTGFVQVTRRRAPRYRSFVFTGLVLAFLISAVVAIVTPPRDGYSQQQLFGYLGVSLGMAFALLGALIAILLERRR